MPTAYTTPNYLTGQVVAVTVGGKTLSVVSGNFDTETTEVNKTNSTSGGYHEFRFGKRMGSGQLTLAYNGDNPPTIVDGSFGVLVIDTVGYELSEGQENQTPGTNGGSPTPTAPAGEVFTCQAGFTKVSRSWNADSGEYNWQVDFKTSGPFTTVAGTGASTTT